MTTVQQWVLVALTLVLFLSPIGYHLAQGSLSAEESQRRIDEARGRMLEAEELHYRVLKRQQQHSKSNKMQPKEER